MLLVDCWLWSSDDPQRETNGNQIYPGLVVKLASIPIRGLSRPLS